MKNIIFVLLSFVGIVFAGCSNADSKFIGKWRNAESNSTDTFTIQKKGDSYDVINGNSPNNFMTFKYDKDHDCLTMEKSGDIFDIKYVDSTKHLLILPRGFVRGYDKPIELQRID